MAIANAGTVSGSGSGTSVVTGSWTPGSNELVLVAVALRDETITPSVSGNGLTFVSVADVDNIQGQNGINLFRAMGSSPSTGAITVTLTGNSLPAFVRAYRFSGVDTSGTSGSGAVEAVATNTGPNPDDDDMLQAVTTVTNDAWAVAFGTHRAGVFTTPAGETTLNINDTEGSGGNVTTLSSWYEVTTTAGSYQLGALNDLDSARDWCMVVVSLKPAAGSSSIAGTSAGVATVSGSLAMGLVGSAAGFATVTAVLSATITTTGSAAGVATVSGAATGKTSLRASIAAKPSTTATITGWGYIAGSAAGIATVSGVLSGVTSIVGTAAGVAATTAVLSATIAITGSAAGVATVSGVLFDASLVIIPPISIGYHARILIADPNRRVIGEAQFAFDSIGWMVNDYMDTTLHCARSDAMTTADNLRPGNWIYIELDNGLPPWAGFIWPGRKFTAAEVEVPVKSAEWYLSRFQVDKGRYFSKATAGYIVERLIAEANATYGMGVAIGEMWGGGDLHSPDYHIESLFDIITKSVIGRLEDCEFHIEPLLVNGVIELTAHLRKRRGARKPDVALVQGCNMIDETIIEVGPLVNHWQLAGDDISGNGQGWGSGRLMDVTTGRDEESIGRHGLWMDSEIYQTVRDQGTLSRLAQSLIRQSKSPAVSFCCGAFNLEPGDFGSYQVGDSVTAVVPTATFEPIHGLYRVLGREFHPDDGTVELAIMEDADV